MPTTLGHLIVTLNSWGAAFVRVAGPMLIQSVAVTAVMLVLVWACSRTRATFRYALLMLVLIKLLLPPSLSLPTGLRYWLRVPDRRQALPQIDFGTIGGSFQLNRPGSGHFRLSRDALLFLTWMAGMGVLAFLIATRYRRVSGMEGTPAPAELQRELDACQEELGLKRSLSLELSSSCASPAVAGLLWPVILIPKLLADSLSRPQLRHVLLHELAHVKRGDLWVNHLQVALQVLYWYNPLLWLTNALIRRVREEAVDQTVMAALGREAESYPSTLVAVAKLAFTRTSFSLGFIGIMESKAAFKRRLARLVQNPVPENAKLGWMRTGVVVATAALLLPMARPQSSDNAKAPAVQSLEARPVVEHGSGNEGITPHRFEFVQALQAQGMTYEQFRQKVAGDRELKPGELESLATQWPTAQKDAAKTNSPDAVTKIVIKRIGPAVAPDERIMAKIGAKVGTTATATQVDADVRNLYATGLFANVRVVKERTLEGTVLTYVVQERPRLAEIAFEGNTKIADAALREKLASRVGEPLDERKLFADAQTIQEAYRRLGFSDAVVKYRTNTNEKTGQSAVTFQITVNRQGAGPVAPEDRLIVKTNAEGGQVTIWDVVTGKPIQSPVYSVAFSPDGQIIATTNTDGKIRIWNLTNRKEPGAPVYSAAFSPDGRLLVTTNSDGSIRVYSPDGQRLGTNQPVYNDPWGNPYIIKGPIRVWDAITGKEIVAPAPKQEPKSKNPGVGVSTQTGVMSDPQFADPSTVTEIKSDPQLKK